MLLRKRTSTMALLSPLGINLVSACPRAACCPGAPGWPNDNGAGPLAGGRRTRRSSAALRGLGLTITAGANQLHKTTSSDEEAHGPASCVYAEACPGTDAILCNACVLYSFELDASPFDFISLVSGKEPTRGWFSSADRRRRQGGLFPGATVDHLPPEHRASVPVDTCRPGRPRCLNLSNHFRAAPHGMHRPAVVPGAHSHKIALQFRHAH